jgi:hypothetical protein
MNTQTGMRSRSAESTPIVGKPTDPSKNYFVWRVLKATRSLQDSQSAASPRFERAS